ncbi:MAG: hypothetical protein IKH86_11360 [Prevotella sp.]|nr:hypothetical protein [Prevotella sp.]
MSKILKLKDRGLWRMVMSVLFGVGVWLFWWQLYPHALSYQEQYQLFQLTGDYFCERLCAIGGLADWLGEFVTQFYFIPSLGAFFLAVVFVALQRQTAKVCNFPNTGLWLLSFVPSLLLLWLMGDESVLLSYPLALLMVMSVACLVSSGENIVCGFRFTDQSSNHKVQSSKFKVQSPNHKVQSLFAAADALLVVVLYWLAGPAVWLYALLRVVLKRNWLWLWLPLWVALVMLLARAMVLQQWPWQEVLLTMTYYRVPMQVPVLLWLIPLVIVGLVALGRERVLGNGGSVGRSRTSFGWLLLGGVACVVVGFLAVAKGFPKDKYELIRQDYLVRSEQWDEIVERAQRYQVPTAFSSVCVNLALGMRHELADRMFSFYQSGEDALIMPRYRDLTSDLPSAEAFWRLGFVNSAQRYMFDIQESILNGKKSCRCTQRIVECIMVNGHYNVARKHLELLKNTLFYRSWALNAEKYLNNDAWVNTHPVWGRLRRLRFKDNFLFSYSEMDTMLGMLYDNNHENRLALEYFLGQLLLKGSMQKFMQYLQWAQQSGFYQSMPIGYQDAVRCVQQQGNVAGSPYAGYVKRKMSGGE